MNKWEESITNKSDKRKLLIESSEFVSKIKLSKGLKESLSMQAGKAGTLIVKNIPVTILDRENLNGRIYSTATMRQAIEEAREAMADKQTLGQANEHPESSFVAPTDASHVIINAYIKENIAIVVDGKKERHNVLFTDWEVLNTTHGKDLRALFEAECSFGTSIRGVGELSGKMVENYSFISVDGVGNPSSSTYTRMPVSESVKVELKDPNELKENYTVMSSSTNVVRDLSQAGVLQQQLNANPYGTVTKTSTKVDQETDPKTGAQTSITTVEADTEDEVSDLQQAFAMAHKAMTNGISKVNSVTIEANEDEDENGNKKESVEGVDVGLENYVPESIEVNEGQVLAQGQPKGIDFLSQLDEKSRYMFLDRMIQDCKYYIDGHKDNKFLWANDPEKQIEYMKWLYNSFPENKKPEWTSMEEIEGLENQMSGKGVEESVMTEATKKQDKQIDPNEGRQYVLKIKDNDPTMEEGSDDAPEFVAMKGNAIRFTKDPKKALHFTQGMEESGIVHYSNIQKLLADMGYGDKNIEKWYKKDNSEVEPKKEGLIGGAIGGTAGGVFGNAVGGPLGALSGAASGYVLGSSIGNDSTSNDEKQESAKLTENGNTKYSANIEVIKKDGLPETKSLPVSSTEINSESLKKEIANQWKQQEASNDVQDVNGLTLVDNQTQEQFNYDPKTNQLSPKKDNNQQQIPAQPVKNPENDINIMEPENVDLGVREESVNGEIKQNDNTLDMDIDDNTHVEKEFDTKAQASVAKAGIESGKLDGNVMLTDDVNDDWKICVVFDKLNYDDEESLYNNADPDSGQHVFSGFNDGKPDKIRVTLYPQEVGNADSWVEIFSLARNKLKDSLGVSGHPHVADFNVFDSNEQFEDGIQDLPESTKNDLKPGWYVAHDKIGISGPYETREACMEGLDDYKDQVSVYEVTESDLNEVLFKNPSKPSDDYVEKPLDEEEVENIFKLQSPNEKEGYVEFKQKDNNHFDILWHDNFVPGIDEPSEFVKDVENTKKLYDKLTTKGWKGDEFAVDNDFEKKKYQLYRQKRGYDNFGDLEFDEDGHAKLYHPYNDIEDLKFYLMDDGKVEVHGVVEVYNDPMEGREYEGTCTTLSYDDANEIWKAEQANGYTKEPNQIEEESVVESSLVPVRFSNIKWNEQDAAYRMFEDIEKDMKISHIEPDVKNANILVEYFENYMNDLNNISVTYNVNPKDIKESSKYQEEIIRIYNEDKNRQYPKIESADINLR